MLLLHIKHNQQVITQHAPETRLEMLPEPVVVIQPPEAPRSESKESALALTETVEF